MRDNEVWNRKEEEARRSPLFASSRHSNADTKRRHRYSAAWSGLIRFRFMPSVARPIPKFINADSASSRGSSAILSLVQGISAVEIPFVVGNLVLTDPAT